MPDLEKIISFEEMITPRIIQVVYVLGAVLITLGGLTSIMRSFLMGLIVILLGNIGWRIYCELIILLFKVKEDLNVIKEEQKSVNSESTLEVEPAEE